MNDYYKMNVCTQFFLLLCLAIASSAFAVESPAATTAPNTASQANAEATVQQPQWLVDLQRVKNTKPEYALQLAKSQLQFYPTWSAPLQAAYQNELALIFQNLSRYIDQLDAAQTGLALLGDQKNNTQVELLYRYGFALEMQRDYAKSADIYRKGLAIATELSNEKLIIEGQLNMAAMAAEDNDLEQAMKLGKDAYQRAVKLNDKESLAEVNAELGLLYAQLQSDDEARSLLEESYRLFDELGFEKSKLMVWYNLAVTYRFQNKAEQAMEIFDQMLKTSLRSEDPIQIYYASLGLATVNSKLKKYDAAVAYMEQADKYLPQLQSAYQFSEHHFEKALIYRALGQTNLAFQQVDLALEKLGDKNNMSDRFYKLHFDQLKSRLYADSGDFEKAYRTLRGYIKGYMDLQNEERDLQVQKLRLSFDAERQQARNELLQKDNELQALRLNEAERKRQNQWLWIALFASTSLILAVLLAWQWRSRRTRT